MRSISTPPNATWANTTATTWRRLSRTKSLLEKLTATPGNKKATYRPDALRRTTQAR